MNLGNNTNWKEIDNPNIPHRHFLRSNFEMIFLKVKRTTNVVDVVTSMYTYHIIHYVFLNLEN